MNIYTKNIEHIKFVDNGVAYFKVNFVNIDYGFEAEIKINVYKIKHDISLTYSFEDIKKIYGL